jgi:hypothetical protein
MGSQAEISGLEIQIDHDDIEALDTFPKWDIIIFTGE